MSLRYLRLASQCSRSFAYRNMSSTARAFAKDSPKNSDKLHPMFQEDPEVTVPEDLWPLTKPEPPAHLVSEAEEAESITMEQFLRLPHPEGRDNEPAEVLRKRLIYESRKRGILEMDLILSTFANKALATMTEEQLRQYDRFLTLPDWSIYYYVTGKVTPPEPWKTSWILDALRGHAENTQRQVRSMPNLE